MGSGASRGEGEVEVYGNTTASYLNPLQVAQNKALRVHQFIYRYHSINPYWGGRVVQFCTNLGIFSSTHRKYFWNALIICDI